MSYDSYPPSDQQPDRLRGGPPDRWALNAGRFWAGVAATAVVAAVTGLVGVLIVEGILDLTLHPPRLNVFGLESHSARYAVAGVLATVLAGGLFHLLLVAAPRPEAFFTWIVLLLTLAAALTPFALTDDTADAIATGVLNAAIGLAILTLLRGVAARTRVPAAGTPPARPGW